MRGAIVLAALALAGQASALTKLTLSEQCGRPTAEYTIKVNDHPGHIFRIEQTSCTSQAPLEIGGAAVKQHQVTGFSEVDGQRGSDHWFHVFTMANGDSIYARSRGATTYRGGRYRSTKAEWTLEGGTGKFEKAKGRGSYTCHPAPGGFACQAEGEYSLPSS